MTYAAAVEFLYELQLFGTKFGLENTFKLAALAGNVQGQLRFIHVAGTNGKGSVCAMLESIYRASGLRVGLFTSPHLVSFAERIQVNRELISEENIVRLVVEIQSLLKQFSVDAHPTFFEVVTVMALKYFAERKCDLVVWETGMGGRLDATNIVTPLASVITNVQFDHEKWLGTTLAQIASEKAGIIKQGVPVITATNEPAAIEVIVKTAREMGSSLKQVSFSETRTPPLDKMDLPLLGEHQRLNAALSLATVRALAPQIPIFEAAIRSGLSQVQWAGRLQQIKMKSGQTILLDGAHNPSGAMALRDAIAKHFPGKNFTLILGMLQDKEWSLICGILAPLAVKILIAPVSSERTAAPEQLESAARKANPGARIAAMKSLAQGFETAAPDSFVVITGSLYLIGEALELLQIDPRGAVDERGLNEWSTSGRQ